MKRVLSIVMLIVAVVTLCGPSLGMGLGLRGVPHAGEVVMTQDGHSALVWKCKDVTSKRTLPCHPDQGVLVPAAAKVVPEHFDGLAYHVVLVGQGHSPTTELPPPRLG